MSDESKSDSANAGSAGAPSPAGTTVSRHLQSLLQLPGLAAIALYMFLLAGVAILGVAGRQFSLLFLIFPAVFIAAGLGLGMLLRWAWAMTLAAAALLACLFFWKFSSSQQLPFIIQGLLNLVFFLYLVRPEVREKLR
jgi:hypothetical protein